MRRPLRVLLFSWFFPPYLAAGSSRTGQLVKYLMRAGAEVTVVTGRPADLPALSDIDVRADVHYAHNYEVNALPARILGRQAVRERGYELARLGRWSFLGKLYKQVVHFPDAQIGWVPGALSTAARLGGPPPDVVMSSSSPASAHIAAARYAAARDLPWIAEFRDPWTNNPTFERWWPARALERAIESRLAARADVVTGITAGFARELEKLFDRDVVHIPNGFDPDDFPAPAPPVGDDLTHVGTVYTSYDIPMFLSGVRAASAQVSVSFIGRSVADLRERVAEDGVGDRVHIVGPRKRSEAIAAMRRSRANLLFLWRHDRALAYTYVPQKLYEYLAAGRPIVAVGDPRGDAGDITRASGLGVFADDTAAVARVLDGGVPAMMPNATAIQAYSYRTIAERFMAVFEIAMERHGRAKASGRMARSDERLSGDAREDQDA